MTHADEIRAKIRQHPDGAKILDAVRKAERDGWEITQGEPHNIVVFLGSNRNSSRYCCVLGALDPRVGVDFADAASSKLGWPHEKAWALAHGFDGSSWQTAKSDEDTKGKHRREWQLGRLFRALLVETP